MSTKKTKRGPAVHVLTRNILATYSNATAREISDGVGWYDAARALAIELDANDPMQAAGVIAALSPRLSWQKNQEIARRTYATGKATGVLSANGTKAERILSGEPAATVLGGKKVRSFWQNIASETSTAVTIDRHAYDVARGRIGTDETRGELSLKGVYEAFCKAYQRAAIEIGISPAQLQAVTWLTWRRLKGLEN